MNYSEVVNLLCGVGEDGPLVDQLSQLYVHYKNRRSKWEEEVDEVRKFVFATDTRGTVGASADFKNNTTIPKIAQIRNNINVSYEEHLFPNTDWVQWEPANQQGSSIDVAKVMQAYTRNKARVSGLPKVISQVIGDWTDTGLAAVEIYHEDKRGKDAAGNPVQLYYGPKCARLDPMDVVYDVEAADLESATKVVRSLHTLGALKKLSINSPSVISPEQFELVKKQREQVATAVDKGTNNLSRRLVRAGFGDSLTFVQNNVHEMLTFYGDFYDPEKDELYENYRIVIIDRSILLSKEPIHSLTGQHAVKLAVWEFREGTLAPMGPLARILGLQYKLDKLENLRADKFDMLANPTIVERGDVTFHGVRGKPGARYTTEEDGDVRELVESAVALNADTQIQFTLALMDDMAGNPKESLGVRTPGEKTKFEVQLLDSGQNKVFRNKVKKFEDDILTPILQEMVSIGRAHLNGADLIGVLNDELGSVDFVEITTDDLSGDGAVVAHGSSLFAQKANALQNLITILSSPAFNLLNPSLSRTALAKTISYLADLGEFNLFTPGIGVQEDQQIQRLAAESQAKTAEVEMTPEDVTNDPQIAAVEQDTERLNS